MKPSLRLPAVASMRIATLFLVGGVVGGCTIQPKSHLTDTRSPMAAAEAFVDAFYSFDPARLRYAMADAPTSLPKILYYQGWAEGGNYVVLDRKPCSLEKAHEVSCGITVRDDLIAALGTGYHVTDTFHLSFQNGRIASVQTSSNDPPEADQALEWVRRERPDVMTGPCRGFFAGGPTPQDCVRAIVRAFADFAVRR